MDENLDQIEQKISSLIAYRSSLVNELKKLSQRRRELRDEIKGITNKLIEGRKAVSEQYLLMGQLRDSHKYILSKIADIEMKAKEIEKVLRKFEKEVPHESGRALKKDLDHIEWRLQTERLSREEEKRLVEYIKKLEIKLHLWEKAYKTRQELNGLLVEAKSLKDELDGMREIKKSAITKLRTQKEALHNIFMVKHQLMQEDREIKQDIDEIKKNLDNTDAELSKLKESKSKILQKKRMDEEASIKAKEKSLLEEARSKAKDRLTKGKSLSWDEFKILLEDRDE